MYNDHKQKCLLKKKKGERKKERRTGRTNESCPGGGTSGRGGHKERVKEGEYGRSTSCSCVQMKQ
jgi:hypothetical protein